MYKNDKNANELRSNFKHLNKRNYGVLTNSIQDVVTEIHKQSNQGLHIHESETPSCVEHRSEFEAVKSFIRNSYDTIRTNALTKRIELTIMNQKTDLSDRIVNEWISQLWCYETYTTIDRRNGKEITKNIKIDKNKVYILVDNESFSPTYDPIDEYFQNVAHLAEGCTQTQEIDKFIACFSCDNDKDVVDKYFKAWFSGVFTNYYSQNDKFDGILILQSEQGTGKTTAIEHHLLKPFQEYVVKNFDWNTSNKDEMIKLATSLFIFDDELSATRKSEIEELKKITSFTYINNVRPPYARLPENYRRKASFIGATNNTNITNDATGTRRFLILGVTGIDLETISTIDYDLLWSEAYNYFYLQKNKIDLRFETIEANNQKFKSVSAEEEYLERYFDFSQEGNIWYTTTEIYDFLKQQEPNLNTDVYKIGKALRSKGLDPQTKRFNGGSPTKRYHLHRIGVTASKHLIASRGGQSKADDTTDVDFDEFFGIKKTSAI